MGFSFSFTRWWGVVIKEFVQLSRDRLTFAMIVGIPVVQLLLFGFAINNDPKHLPTMLVLGEQTAITRTIETALKTSEYFDYVGVADEKTAEKAIKQGDINFIVTVPSDFTKKLVRGEKPELLIQADATDPTASAGAISAASGIMQSVISKDIKGPLSRLLPGENPFSIVVHKQYNPEGLTQYNIVPGLMGIILTMTTVMMTGLAVTRERERGNMENLLATPISSLELMTGKIVPYIFIGHIQLLIIIALSLLLFSVPFIGSPWTLYLAALLFIAANLTVGITLSSFAKNQLQGLQLTFFYFLPNILLSGFMFPFAGMPKWAQCIGDLLPLTYFNRCVRGVLLKGSTLAELWPNLWPMAVFMIAVMAIATLFFKKTL